MGKSTKKKPVIDSDGLEEDTAGEEASEEPIYHVEVITKARVVPLSDDDEESYEEDSFGRKRLKGGKWEYYVKWADYDSEENTWEPEENVAGCDRLLKSFWNHIGFDNKDYEVGRVLEADSKWIKREKKHSKKQIKSDKYELKKQRRIQQKITSSSASRKRAEPTDLSFTTSSVHSKEKKSTASFLKRKRDADEDEEGSSDELPLSQAMRKPKKKIRKASNLSSMVTDRSDRSASPNSLFSAPSTQEPNPEAKEQLIPVAVPLPLPSPKQSVGKGNMSSMISNPAVQTKPNLPITSASTTLTAPTPISTKQRLAATALTPTLPNASLNPVAIPLPPVKKPNKLLSPPGSSRTNAKVLSKLTFKKTAPPEPQPIAWPSQQTQIPILQTAPANEDLSGFPMQALPISPQMQARPIRLPKPQSLIPKTTSTSAAEDFLKGIMPKELAAPLGPPTERPFEPTLPKSLPTVKQPLPPRIPKKYKWTGNFDVEAQGSDKTICKIILTDCTDPIPNGMRFGVALASSTKLCLPSFTDAFDVVNILPACQPVPQLARINTQEGEDATNLTTFARFMAKKQKVGLIPINLDGHVVGHFILFPPSVASLSSRFNVPPDLKQNTTLIAAILPWTLNPAQISQEGRKAHTDLLAADIHSSVPMKWDRSAKAHRTKHPLQRAARILCLPSEWPEYMVPGADRRWHVWCEGAGRFSKAVTGIETKALSLLMEYHEAMHVQDKTWRILFIHISSLANVYKCPGFVEKRATRHECAIFSYGSCDGVPRSEWGLKPIYTCGGVATFTPRALYEDPNAVRDLFDEIEQHPLWVGYVLPSSIGIAAKIVAGSEDPMVAFERSNFPLHPILNAIDDGKIALLTSPPDPSSCSETERAGWIRRYFIHHPSGPRETLEQCLRAVTSKYGDSSSSEWLSSFQNEVVDDLLVMQRQPIIMREYRRYVIISGSDRATTLQDKVEWSTVSDFTFGDGFVSKNVGTENTERPDRGDRRASLLG